MLRCTVTVWIGYCTRLIGSGVVYCDVVGGECRVVQPRRWCGAVYLASGDGLWRDADIDDVCALCAVAMLMGDGGAGGA